MKEKEKELDKELSEHKIIIAEKKRKVEKELNEENEIIKQQEKDLQAKLSVLLVRWSIVGMKKLKVVATKWR